MISRENASRPQRKSFLAFIHLDQIAYKLQLYSTYSSLHNSYNPQVHLPSTFVHHLGDFSSYLS